MAEYLKLKYIYADSMTSAPQSSVLSSSVNLSLTSESLLVMSSQWILALQEASLLCDEEEVLHLLQQIPPEHQSLATSLRALAKDFQFQQIRQLTFSK